MLSKLFTNNNKIDNVGFIIQRNVFLLLIHIRKLSSTTLSQVPNNHRADFTMQQILSESMRCLELSLLCAEFTLWLISYSV